MPILKGRKYTAEEFFELTPESNSERYELINGEIVDLAAPNQYHQKIVGEVFTELNLFIRKNKGKCNPFVSPFDVKIDEYNVIQPDIMVICNPNILDDKRCNGAPDLVIEITSSNSKRDYFEKLSIYRNSGVREYWIVDPDEKKIVVFLFEQNNNINIYTFDQDIPVGIFNNELKINIAQLL